MTITSDDLARMRTESWEHDLWASLEAPALTTDMVVVFADERGRSWAAIRHCTAMQRLDELAELGIDTDDLNSPISWGSAFLDPEDRVHTFGNHEGRKATAGRWLTAGEVTSIPAGTYELF